jgi:mRNA interferase MazF
MYNTIVNRGDIFLVQLPETSNSQQTGTRPFIITSNFLCNKYSPILTGIPLTSKLDKHPLPTHVSLGLECGLLKNSIALAEQIMPVDRILLKERVGYCTDEVMQQIERAIQIQNGIVEQPINIKIINDSLNLLMKIEKMLNYNLFSSNDDDLRDLINEKNLIMGELQYTCRQYNIDYNKLVLKHMNKNNVHQGDGVNNVKWVSTI